MRKVRGFPFRILLKNALEGKNDVFLSGKFKVATYAPDQAIPEYKGKQEFYIVHALDFGCRWCNRKRKGPVRTSLVRVGLFDC